MIVLKKSLQLATISVSFCIVLTPLPSLFLYLITFLDQTTPHISWKLLNTVVDSFLFSLSIFPLLQLHSEVGFSRVSRWFSLWNSMFLSIFDFIRFVLVYFFIQCSCQFCIVNLICILLMGNFYVIYDLGKCWCGFRKFSRTLFFCVVHWLNWQFFCVLR